jgi:hypothetical protein
MPPDTPPETLVPKDTLPITHAVVICKISADGTFEAIAAVEIRQDGHTQAKGAVEEHARQFIQAARTAVRNTFLTQAEDVFGTQPTPPAAEAPSA